MKILRSLWALLIQDVVPDALLLGGIGLVVWGIHYWSLPGAFVVGGLCAVYASGKMVSNK